MSEVILDFVEPYTEHAETYKALNSLLMLAIIAWNTALLPRNEHKGMIDRPIADLSLPRAERKELRGLMADLIERKNKYFADYTRPIMDYQLTEAKNGYHLSIASSLIHIAEEPPINPSLLLSLSGCGLRCRYCQQAALLDPASVDGEQLDAAMWEKLCIDGARSLSFIGGNPDESLYAVLRFLATAPSNWELPVVWNCHAYGTPETMRLLDGLVDVYVPDFKYGDEYC